MLSAVPIDAGVFVTAIPPTFLTPGIFQLWRQVVSPERKFFVIGSGPPRYYLRTLGTEAGPSISLKSGPLKISLNTDLPAKHSLRCALAPFSASSASAAGRGVSAGSRGTRASALPLPGSRPGGGSSREQARARELGRSQRGTGGGKRRRGRRRRAAGAARWRTMTWSWMMRSASRIPGRSFGSTSMRMVLCSSSARATMSSSSRTSRRSFSLHTDPLKSVAWLSSAG